MTPGDGRHRPRPQMTKPTSMVLTTFHWPCGLPFEQREVGGRCTISGNWCASSEGRSSNLCLWSGSPFWAYLCCGCVFIDYDYDYDYAKDEDSVTASFCVVSAVVVDDNDD